MDDTLLLKISVGVVITLLGGVLVHLHLRVLAIEGQIADVMRTIREEVSRDLASIWAARERDREQRERDIAAANDFRERILTMLGGMATKTDVDALENRISSAVRMIMNERFRRDGG